MPEFTCQTCGSTFDLPQHVLDRYPGWTPRQCRSCRDGSSQSSGSSSKKADTAPPNGGPQTGVFTDGGASPNPGPGGWGAVYVIDGEIVAERHGADPDTTNNRMELTALIEGCDLIPEGTKMTLYSDSTVSVRTINEWAAGWEQRGWKRKSGEIKNLDLVKKLYFKVRKRPELSLEWVKGHSGYQWNEYADELANRWREG